MKKLALLLFVFPLVANSKEETELLLKKVLAAGYVAGQIQPIAQSAMDKDANTPLTLQQRMEAFERRAQTFGTWERECVECFADKGNTNLSCASMVMISAGFAGLLTSFACIGNCPAATGFGVVGGVCCLGGICCHGDHAKKIIDGPLYFE